jgi:hypothetical protein
VLGDRFEVLGELGRGGSAVVLLAHDRVRGEQIALKVLHPHVADRPAAATRLRRELRAAARVRHPGAWVAHEVHELDGQLLLCMPVHPGTSLRDHVATQGPWTAGALERLCGQLASVLAAAHRAGVVHRDVSPTNVLIDGAGDAVLSDFDLARLDDAHTASTAAVLGTPGFTAPEVLEGGRADPRSDLYALGAVLYLAATGTPPFGSDQAMAIVRRQLDGRFLSLSKARPDLPPALTRTIDLLLSADPGQRPTSAREVEDLLRRPVEPIPPEPVEVPEHKPHLPPGPYAVHLREHRDDRGRRRRLRREQRRLHRPGVLARTLSGLGRRARNAMATVLPALLHPSPERQLARAVALVAGLPLDALLVAPTVYEARFKLVDGVSAEAAANLQRAAVQAGFVAEVREASATTVLTPSGPRLVYLAGAFLLPGLAAIPIGLAATGAPPALVVASGAPLLLTTVLAALASFDHAVRSAPVELPTAYGHDLRLHVRFEDQHLLAAPRPAPVVTAAAPAPALRPPPPPRADPPQDALTAVLARLDALAADAGRATHLARPMHHDLLQHLARLREEAWRLHKVCEQVDALLGDHAPQLALEEAADRLQRRLRRLQTLQRAGRKVDQAELDQLERSFEQHLDELLSTDALEARRVQAVARLLEIGAVANEVRRELFGGEVTRSLDDVLAQVRSEVAAGQRALDEVERPVAQTPETRTSRLVRAAARARQAARST